MESNIGEKHRRATEKSNTHEQLKPLLCPLFRVHIMHGQGSCKAWTPLLSASCVKLAVFVV